MGYNTSSTALIYSVFTFGYLLSAIIPPNLPASLPRKYIVFLGLAGSCFAFAFVGPVFFIPESALVLCIGMSLVGLGYAFVYIPNFSIMHQYLVDVGDPNDITSLSDLISSKLHSGFLMMNISFGLLIGPPLLGMVADLCGMTTAFELLSLSFLVMSIAFLCLMSATKKTTEYTQLPQASLELTDKAGP
mmetsp:Transcript_6255/g.10847  ORF Transcript_6255/g.10847 Transcript_6255/m.10847 type:complete len:189 (+) Transcript_6255:607-1173(+)